MPINKYVCPAFEEEIEPEQLIQRVLDSHHKVISEEKFFRKLKNLTKKSPIYVIEMVGGRVEGRIDTEAEKFRPDKSDACIYKNDLSLIIDFHRKAKTEREFFRKLLQLINEAPFNVALVDGVAKGTPMAPDGYIGKHSPRWAPIEMKSYMLVPYIDGVNAVTPLLSVEQSLFNYTGEDPEQVQFHIRKFLRRGRKQEFAIVLTRENCKDLGELKRKIETDPATALESVINLGSFTPVDISGYPSGPIKEMRERINRFIEESDKFMNIGCWAEVDFYGDIWTHNRIDDYFEEYYRRGKIEFV